MADEIRTAASAMLGRDGPDGLELLVVERSASSRFLPSYVAFPGGAVEPDDPALAARWFGDAAESARAAAVRELVEEVDLAITDGPTRRAGRRLEAVDVEPPPAERLVEVAHWIAPEEVPVRFDARYFAVAALDAEAPIADGLETADAWWVSPRRLLAEWEAGERRLYWPTWLTVTEAARCEDVASLLRWRLDTREPTDAEVEAMPPSVFWQDR